MSLRLGSLFSGYGGLDLAIERVFGARTVWVSDIDPGPCKVLAHRFPHARNLGDITKVNWADVDEVDLAGGGSPCQDISSAGAMAGMVAGTRSNLWVEMREAIRHLQPMFVVWENVQAARSTKAASRSLPAHLDNAIEHHLSVSRSSLVREVRARHQQAAHRLMESRARRVGVPYPKPALRALGRVLGDLADLGYDTEWISLPASGVGAPHRRQRYFVLAANARGQSWLKRWGAAAREAARGRALGEPAGRDRAPVVLLPTPTAQDAANLAGHSQRSRNTPPLNTVVTLLPTPSAGNFNDGEDPDEWEARRQRIKATGVNGNGMGMPLGVAVQLLPTPRATDGEKGGPNQRGSSGDLMLPSAVAMLPTPTAADGGGTHGFGLRDWTQGSRRYLPTPRATRGGSATETVDLLPTPSVADAMGGHERRGGDRGGELLLKGIATEQAWGPYAPAIARWEAIAGPAPAPTKPGRKGRPKLNPDFALWMMGAAPGWVTDVPGVTDNEALKMAGNGVVQLQAEVALWVMLHRWIESLAEQDAA
ncbi:MAG: DNA cytosine methyltransferase [Propionicimonas sp.]